MKLNYLKTIKVGTAFAIIMVFWSAYDYVVPLLLENAFGLSNSMRGLIMGLDNLLSLFMLPLFGKISDKITTKFGKRTPFIVIGTLITVALMIFVPVTAQNQLNQAMDLREEITDTFEPSYSYTDDKGVTYDDEGIYSMLYDMGAENADYCDRQYLSNNGIDTKEEYLQIALSGKDSEGEFTDDYNKFVKTGIKNYASKQVELKITQHHPETIAIYMIILFFVLVAMATFRSPAVALMPDVTPKPLRSQANAMINLAGGAGGAIAFIIYTVVLSINPTGYVAVFGLIALAMVLLLITFLLLVKEPRLVQECADQCADYGISNDDEPEADTAEEAAVEAANTEKHKKAKMVSFSLILASIFMWFLGYNAVTSNLSIYITKTLNLSAGLGGVITGVSMGISAIAFIPVGYLAVKIGRKKSIMIGFALAVVSFVLVFLFAANYNTAVAILFTVFYLIAGFGLIIANVNTFPMVVELSNTKNIGKYTGLYYTATMSAQAITPYIAGLIMDAFGNKYLFIYSAVCIIVGIVLMYFVRHGDSRALPPKSKLELLGADD
jgi:MFS family permease